MVRRKGLVLNKNTILEEKSETENQSVRKEGFLDDIIPMHHGNLSEASLPIYRDFCQWRQRVGLTEISVIGVQ